MKQNILFLSLFILIGSCYPDDIIQTGSETEIPNSTEVGTTKLLGLVTDEFGNVIEQASIDLYQDGILLQSSSSLADGTFQFADVAFSNSSYRLHIHKDNYYNNLQAFRTNDIDDIQLEISIISKNEDIEVLELSPTDSTLVYISGILINDNGPIPNTTLFIAEENYTIFNFAITQSDGTFHFFVPRDMLVQLILISPCDLDFFLNTIDLGSFDQDTSIDEIRTDISAPNILDVYGLITSCDSMSVNGFAIFYSLVNSFEVSNVLNIEEGVISGSIVQCNDSDPVILEIYDENLSEPLYSDYVTIDVLDSLNLDLCNIEVSQNNIFFSIDDRPIAISDPSIYIDTIGALILSGITSAFATPIKLSLEESSDNYFNLKCFLFEDNLQSIQIENANIPVELEFLPTGHVRGFINDFLLDPTTNNQHHLIVDFILKL